MPPRRRFALFLRSLFLLVPMGVVASCDSGGCPEGGFCECASGDQCYLDCDGNGCQQRCHDMNVCGAVCDSGCHFECFGTNECTDACGAGCSMDCSGTDRCGALCGADCDYRCHSAGRCGARVGPGSTVACENVGSCVVECDGDCRVTCVGVGGPGCQVTCLSGAPAANCGGGVFACPSC